MVKIVGLSAVLLSLSGCAWLKPAVVEKIVTVEVPVPVQCPIPQKLPLPRLRVSELVETDSPDVVQKAYVADVESLKQAVKDREKQLDVYRNQKPLDQKLVVIPTEVTK